MTKHLFNVMYYSTNGNKQQVIFFLQPMDIQLSESCKLELANYPYGVEARGSIPVKVGLQHFID